ncbi:unnamed protein product [Chrysodeixis includens]|uniref:Uncharacterized protein n=1 Tax=Chrysodeixis includens TaxID=689277 RepID=A0A9N8Q1W9_CHRIL|nr:unnamed protein product [Chrysodeixis includens]
MKMNGFWSDFLNAAANHPFPSVPIDLLSPFDAHEEENPPQPLRKLAELSLAIASITFICECEIIDAVTPTPRT